MTPVPRPSKSSRFCTGLLVFEKDKAALPAIAVRRVVLAAQGHVLSGDDRRQVGGAVFITYPVATTSIPARLILRPSARRKLLPPVTSVTRPSPCGSKAQGAAKVIAVSARAVNGGPAR